MEPRTKKEKKKKDTKKKPKKKQKKPKKTLKQNPEAKCMVCTWLKNFMIDELHFQFDFWSKTWWVGGLERAITSCRNSDCTFYNLF